MLVVVTLSRTECLEHWWKVGSRSKQKHSEKNVLLDHFVQHLLFL